MSEHEWKAMNDHDFDAMLTESISELPPDDIAADVTPWRRAMNRILFGFALCAITLNILGLNYILPTIGMETTKSHFSRTSLLMPKPSLPITTASFPFRSAL